MRIWFLRDKKKTTSRRLQKKKRESAIPLINIPTEEATMHTTAYDATERRTLSKT
jgi:hypothetical protein